MSMLRLQCWLLATTHGVDLESQAGGKAVWNTKPITHCSFLICLIRNFAISILKPFKCLQFLV